MNPNKFTESTINSLNLAVDISKNNKQQNIKAEILALAILEQTDGLIPRILEKMSLNLKKIKESLNNEIQKFPKIENLNLSNENIGLDPKTYNILTKAESIMNNLEDSYLSVEHIFWSMLENLVLFKKLGIDLEKYKEVLM
ncbi:MAG: type VI secretion system ATPase TssH, partial [Fusobacterium sp.]|nr:type VI secretion system ATPase TssH [Fusobacterium sp.]